MSALLASTLRSASPLAQVATRSISNSIKNAFFGRVFTPRATFATQTESVANHKLQTHNSKYEPIARKLIGAGVLTSFGAGLYGFFKVAPTQDLPKGT